MDIRYLYIDNLIVTMIAYTLTYLLFVYVFLSQAVLYRTVMSIIPGGLAILGAGYALTMIRFWRTPRRKVTAKANEIISPADGNVIYIKKIENNEIPIAIKDGELSTLNELTKTNLLTVPCWLIGINMTPFDVHKNCAPISGKIILNHHENGKFLSLKDFKALKENERNTLVIENEQLRIGVVQIASKLVRRIDSYIKEGDNIENGDWFGMIRFGSQVDIILPQTVKVNIKLGQQVYARTTIIGIL